jgi:hypothetical protein
MDVLTCGKLRKKIIVLFGMNSSVNMAAQRAKVILYNSGKCLKRNVEDGCVGAQTEIFVGGGGWWAEPNAMHNLCLIVKILS